MVPFGLMETSSLFTTEEREPDGLVPSSLSIAKTADLSRFIASVPSSERLSSILMMVVSSSI